MLSLCGCRSDENHPEEEIISYTISSDPMTLDPQIAQDHSSLMLITNLFEGLVRCDENGKIKNGMAESYTVSADKMSYVFHLYENTQWSDGTPVTANDFIFGIKRALNPETGASRSHDLFIIKNAEDYYNGNISEKELGLTALDEHTLKIDLEYSTDDILTVLASPVAMPCCEKFFKEAKGKYGKDDKLTVTNGPFRIRETYGWDHDNYIYIRRNENYKAANPAIPLGVNFNYHIQADDPINSILTGECDICEIYSSDLKSANENELKILTNTNSLWGICFNTSVEAFDNTDIRISLLKGLDRKSLLKATPNSYIKTSHLIGEDVSVNGENYRNSVGDIFIETNDEPAQIYSKGTQSLTEQEIELKSTYTILYLDDTASSKLVTRIIEQWNKISGCYFNKQPLSRSELDQRLENGNYEIAIAPLRRASDTPTEFFSRFTSNSKNNYISLNSSEYDSYFSSLENSEVMLSSLKNAETYLIGNGYLYPLYYESRYFACSNRVSGILFERYGEAIDFSQITKNSK